MIAEKVNWVGCQGSEPHFRGFPCSLWILFHFLTVQATQEGVDHSQERGEWRPGHPRASAHPIPSSAGAPAGLNLGESAFAARDT